MIVFSVLLTRCSSEALLLSLLTVKPFAEPPRLQSRRAAAGYIAPAGRHQSIGDCDCAQRASQGLGRRDFADLHAAPVVQPKIPSLGERFACIGQQCAEHGGGRGFGCPLGAVIDLDRETETKLASLRQELKHSEDRLRKETSGTRWDELSESVAPSIFLTVSQRKDGDKVFTSTGTAFAPAAGIAGLASE